MVKVLSIILFSLILIFIWLIFIIPYKYFDKNISTNKSTMSSRTKLIYPNHIAFIMDGNGRWANLHNKDRTYGHLNGGHNLEDIFYNCFNNGSKYLTFYVFSEQNWKRTTDEINNIFNIIYDKLILLHNAKLNYRIVIQGRLDRIPNKLRKLVKTITEDTKKFTRTIILCLDYSGRNEILNTCKKLINKKLEPTIENFSKNLYVKDIPDPDLIIRTSGEKRISDFLLWQLSYSEFYFTDVYWPDFDLKELEKAIRDYNTRDRRYGFAK